MSEITPALWALWLLTAALIAGAVVCAVTGWRRLTAVLTAAEWRAAFQLVAIVGMVVTIIYFQNGHRYGSAEFIYGRF